MKRLFLGLIGCTPNLNDPLVADAGPDQIIEVGQTLTLDASQSTDAIEYVWTLGDGRQERSDSPLVSHDWEEPGHYTVYLEIHDTLGRTATDSLRLTVHHTLLPTPPRASTTLVSNPTGRLLFALLPTSSCGLSTPHMCTIHLHHCSLLLQITKLR